jgi:hypothetical protein
MVLSIIFALRFTTVFLFKKIKDKMKSNKIVTCSIIFGIIVGVIMLLLQLLTHKDPEFTQFTDGITRDLQDRYYENILVKNAHKNGLGQYEMMIAYFDSVGLSISDLSEMPGIKYYDMWFYKSTEATRKYFTEKREDRRSKDFDRIEPYVYLGHISMFHCGHDSTEWVTKVSIKTGVSEEDDIIYESTVLSNECGANIDEENDRLLGYFIGRAKENDELVRYYMELKDKKNAN